MSKTHYIPPLSSTFANNAGSDNAPNEQWFHISTPSENAVNFTIKRGDGSEFATGTVSNTVPWTDRANLGDNQNDQFGSCSQAEMQRRFVDLQFKRSELEKELKRVN